MTMGRTRTRCRCLRAFAGGFVNCHVEGLRFLHGERFAGIEGMVGHREHQHQYCSSLLLALPLFLPLVLPCIVTLLP